MVPAGTELFVIGLPSGLGGLPICILIATELAKEF